MPTTPLPTTTTSTTRPLFPPIPSAISFQHDSGVRDNEIEGLRQLLSLAQAKLGDSGPVKVFVYNDLEELIKAGVAGGGSEAVRARYSQGGVAEAGVGTIVIYMPNFRNHGSAEKVVFHEYYHTVQGYLLGFTIETSPFSEVPRAGPLWLVEGSAEYVGYKLADAQGFSDYSSARQMWVSVTRSLPSLASYEKRDDVNAQPYGSLYDIGPLAAEFLEAHYGADSAKYSYWRNFGTFGEWHKAFAQTFGLSVEDFYLAFAEFRSTL